MNNIRKLRVKNGLTQSKLAKLLNTTKSNISIMEKEKITKKFVEPLMKIFNCSAVELLGEDIFYYYPETEQEKQCVIEMLNKNRR